MRGGRKRGIEMCGVKSCRRARHTTGCSAEEEEEELKIMNFKIYISIRLLDVIGVYR